MSKRYPRDFRDDVVCVVLARDPGVPMSGIAADSSVGKSSLQNWLQEAAQEPQLRRCQPSLPMPWTLANCVGAALAEQTDEGAEGHRALGLKVLARSRMKIVTGPGAEVVGGPVLELSA